MLSSTTLQENWDQLREKIRQKWSQFSESELDEFSGNAEELVDRIQSKTGANRESIEEFLQTSSQEGARAVNRVKEHMGQTWTGARDTVGQVAEQARHGYQQVQARVGDAVHDRPAISLAAAFGLGVLAGIGLSLLLFDNQSEPMSRQYARGAENFGRKFWDAIAQNLPDTLSRRA